MLYGFNPGDPKLDEEIVGSDSIREKNGIFKKNSRFIGKPKLIDTTNVESVLPLSMSLRQGNRTGTNGQTQLWQFSDSDRQKAPEYHSMAEQSN